MHDHNLIEEIDIPGEDSQLVQQLPDPDSVQGNPELAELSELSIRGYQYIKENKIDEAIECFMKILEKDNANNYALVGLGDSYRKKGDFKKAMECYKTCLSHHPTNNYALFGLADCFKGLRQFNKAIDIWEQYLEHDSTNITVLTRVADAYRKVRDFRRSRSVYLKVLESEQDNPYALIGLGHLHYDFKDFREALHYWTRMVEIRPDEVDIRVLTSIGNCYRKLKVFEAGIPFFDKALLKEPNNFYALFGMADCYRGIGKQDMSLIYWNRILDLDPKNKVILTRAGDACRSMGEFDDAASYYHRALDLEFDFYAVLGLAIIARIQGRYDEAITSLRRLIQNDPKNHRFYLELAQCQLSSGDKFGAVETLQEFQKLGIRNSSIHDAMTRLQRL